MTAERDPMTLNESSAPALGVEERSDETPRAGRARPTPDPEVVAKPKRRQFTARYRLRILEEAERCTQPGEVGRLLRREAWELVPPGRNPCRSVRRYKQHSRERFLTPEEYRCLGRALSEVEANGSVWPPAIAAIRLLMLTGCRHSEILTLRWDDVDRTAGELRLRDAKTGSRMVPMTAPVAAVLDGIRREPGIPG